jgi:uncharacterized coiled-coil DUF342 family protein
VKAECARQRKAHDELSSDLEGHRQALAQREEDLAASNQLLVEQRMAAEAMEKELREQLEAHVAGRQELMEEQAALQSHQAELQGALEARVADAAVLNADLDFLRGSMRNRADNLKRVLRGRQGKPYLPPRGGELGDSEGAP